MGRTTKWTFIVLAIGMAAMSAMIAWEVHNLSQTEKVDADSIAWASAIRLFPWVLCALCAIAFHSKPLAAGAVSIGATLISAATPCAYSRMIPLMSELDQRTYFVTTIPILAFPWIVALLTAFIAGMLFLLEFLDSAGIFPRRRQL